MTQIWRVQEGISFTECALVIRFDGGRPGCWGERCLVVWRGFGRIVSMLAGEAVRIHSGASPASERVPIVKVSAVADTDSIDKWPVESRLTTLARGLIVWGGARNAFVKTWFACGRSGIYIKVIGTTVLATVCGEIEVNERSPALPRFDIKDSRFGSVETASGWWFEWAWFAWGRLILIDDVTWSHEIRNKLPVVLNSTITSNPVEIYQSCDHIVSQFLRKRRKAKIICSVCNPFVIDDSIKFRGFYIIFIVDDKTKVDLSNVRHTVNRHCPSIMTGIENAHRNGEINCRSVCCIYFKRGQK